MYAHIETTALTTVVTEGRDAEGGAASAASSLLRVESETIRKLVEMLRAVGHDPSAAKAGWRSDDPFVTASLLAMFGYFVFPCDKMKRPLTRRGLHNATSNLATISYWQRTKSACGWCIRTGRYENGSEQPGLWIFDIDDAAGYARLAELETKLGPLPPTWTNLSGREGGGEHRMFRPVVFGPDMKTVPRAMILGERGKIDQKGRGGYAVGAGSYHSSGRRYRWADGRAPDEIALAELPAKWVAAMDKADESHGQADTGTPIRRPASIPRASKMHDRSSLLIGDGPGYGGFDTTLYKNAIQYFLMAGVDAPANIIIETLREIVSESPKDKGRDVSRYLRGGDLPRIVERARNYVVRIKE